ncbi:MAG: hypothetical protein PHQ28_03085 [Mycobacterium sp.]|nr:hypothetical protein [Mycobacterium sp.]
MTVLSRGARGRRGGRRPGWVLLTALLVLAMGASSALVFTNRVELLKLAVILALWAAVAGAFVSVLYRRQSDADQSRVRDLKLVYDLQLDREISARREYELTVESQLRRELAAELRARAADDVAALRAELSALRTSLEILFDIDLKQRPALETPEAEAPRVRAYGDWDRNGGRPPVDWVSSDRVTSVPEDRPAGHAASDRADDTAIIDVPEEPLLPPRQQPPPSSERARLDDPAPSAPCQASPPPNPGQRSESQPPSPEPEPRDRNEPPERASRDRDADTGDPVDGVPVEPEPARPDGAAGRRARSRHSADYRDFGVRNFAGAERPHTAPEPPVEDPPPPRLAAPPAAEPAPRHRGAEASDGPDGSAEAPPSGGQSVADLLTRLQVGPSGGGRRRRRDD